MFLDIKGIDIIRHAYADGFPAPCDHVAHLVALLTDKRECSGPMFLHVGLALVPSFDSIDTSDGSIVQKRGDALYCIGLEDDGLPTQVLFEQCVVSEYHGPHSPISRDCCFSKCFLTGP